MKCTVKHLNIDQKTQDGKAQKLTFAVEIDLGERFGNVNLAASIHDLQQHLIQTFFMACVEKGILPEEYVTSYLPRKAPKREVSSW